MKFYVYIADAKVDALVTEIAPEDREGLASELNVDPALLRAGLSQRGASDELRFARAAAVAAQLRAAGTSGPPEDSAPYVAGQLELHWGRLRHVRGGELLRHETESPVTFASAGDGCELIMVGSASNLLAQPLRATIDHENEAPLERAWFVAAGVAPDYDAIDRRCLSYLFDDTWRPARDADRAGWPNEPAPSEPWMERLERARRELRALPVQRLEIVAKRIATFDRGTWDSTGRNIERSAPIVLAAPVAVAMVV